MASYASRRERERRRRARIRRKITVTAIIMLIIGIVLGYLLNTFLHEGSVFGVDIMDQPVLATATPAATPTVEPTVAPTATPEPTAVPTPVPTAEPTAVPTEVPTAAPTEVPTVAPTEAPTEVPTVAPTATVEPTAVPTVVPTVAPTEVPAATAEPVAAETAAEVQTTETETVTGEVVQTVETTAQAVETETVEVKKAEPVIVPFGHSQTFETQILQNGSSRREASDEAYETLNLTLTATEYKDHQYYVDTYTGKYKIKGDEAALEFKMTLNDYAGTQTIQPQEFLLITFCKENGESLQGYQITDAEIAGQVGVTLQSDVTKTMYKRYPYNEAQGNMEYMVVTAYNDGVETEYWFQTFDPVAEAAKAQARAEEEARLIAEATMTIGSEGENVKKLQRTLIDMNLLSGTPDGKFGKYTAEAVKTLQGRYGMEKTGVTSPEFLEKLYD